MLKHYIKIIIGDMNDKVGEDLMMISVGSFRLHDECDDDWTRLTDINDHTDKQYACHQSNIDQ
jgi:hypothetical protein